MAFEELKRMEEIFVENFEFPYGNWREGILYSMREILKGCVKSKRLYFDYFRYVRDSNFLTKFKVFI
jgi:hypothetical protein